MKRCRMFLLCPLLIASAAGCSTTTRPAHRPAVVNHVVLFRLEDPAQAEALIADCDAKMSRVPGVVAYFCGRHVDTGRPTVDADYDVGFYVGFDSLEAYRSYVEHPDHKALVEKWRPQWRWIRVHDIFDPTP